MSHRSSDNGPRHAGPGSLSYWQRDVGITDVAPPPPPERLTCDLCIVGGGVIGASVAWWASRAGIDGIVLEARSAAMGASGRNAGFVASGVAHNYQRAIERYGRARARLLWALSIENRETMLALAARLGVPHYRTSLLTLAESEEEAEELELAARRLSEDGFPGRWEPEMLVERGFLGALRREGDGATQPAHFTRALLSAGGFRLIEGARVTHLDARPDGVDVHVGPLRVRARRVVLATNGYSAALHPYLGALVTPMRGQIMLTEPTPLRFEPGGSSHYGYYYFRQVREPGYPALGRWLLGGARHLHLDSESGTLDERPTPPLQADLEAWTARHFPEFAPLRVEHRWAGTMGFTADGLPIEGRLPEHERLYFCVGFNGHGMGLGTLVARDLVARMVGEQGSGLFDATRLES